jgi:hypothetical protein
MLPDEQPSPEQIAIWRRMTPERRMELAQDLYWTAREFKASGIKSRHPDWGDEQVKAEVTQIFRNSRT